MAKQYDQAELESIASQLPSASLSAIAGICRLDWPVAKRYFGVVPYLDALGSLDQITDSYGDDSGESIVAYFLSNATTWRGDVAKLVKKELKRRLR